MGGNLVGLGANVGAGASTTLDQAKLVEIPDGPADGDAGGAEPADEGGLAWDLLAGLVFPVKDLLAQGLEDLLVFGDVSRWHGWSVVQ